MIRFSFFCVCVCLLATSMAPAQQGQEISSPSHKIVLGQLANGASVSFVRSSSGGWGIEISANDFPRLTQEMPAQVEVYRGKTKIHDLGAGYHSVSKDAGVVVAKAIVKGAGKVTFTVVDRWKIAGNELLLSRKVTVQGTEDNAGFYSAIRLAIAPTVAWSNIRYFVPGLLYGNPARDGDKSPGGVLNDRAKHFEIREDYMSAPLFGLWFRNGRWVAVLDPSPRGDTTWAETSAPAAKTIIDGRLQFGALGADAHPGSGVQFGFWYPGTVTGFMRGPRAPSTPVVQRRYHPVRAGFSQEYRVEFRFGRSTTFPEMERAAWRWAWHTLNPPIRHLNLDAVRRAETNQLESHVISVDGRAGVPFLFDAVTGKPGSFRTPNFTAPGGPVSRPPYPQEQTPEQKDALAAWARSVGVNLDTNTSELWRWPKVVMGFVSKGIGVANQLLIEGDRDHSARGRKMRQSGLTIIDSFIRLVPMSPPAAEGFDLETGKPVSEPGGVVFLRAPSQGLRTLLKAYLREKREGRVHPEWLRYCREFANWLLTQQRTDGSFPRSWHNKTGQVLNPSGTSSYNPVPLLALLSKVTADKQYLDSAVRAANYIWNNYGAQGVYVGGTTDNPNVVDKEAGMLSIEAFLSLYHVTHNPVWLHRAVAAGNYTETWIWIWNVPMPIGANDATLAWKRGVPTVGVQGITARGPGGVDEYLDWATTLYAQLYEDTHDPHYLDVTRVLLFDTKSMLALPGRTYDLHGPGWQQENWRMGWSGRGYGSHRSWLPWVSVNHLHSITSLELYNPALYQQLVKEDTK